MTIELIGKAGMIDIVGGIFLIVMLITFIAMMIPILIGVWTSAIRDWKDLFRKR